MKLAMLLDVLLKEFDIRTDKHLAEFLGMYPPQVSKMRSGKMLLSAVAIVRIHELTKWPIETIKTKAGYENVHSSVRETMRYTK